MPRGYDSSTKLPVVVLLGLAGRPSMAGKHHTKQTREKISKALKGKSLTEQHKRKLSLANIGKHPFKPLTEEERLNISRATKAAMALLPPEVKEKMRVASGFALSGPDNMHYGIPKTPEIKAKIRATIILNGSSAGSNNPNWKGGISKDPYPFEFDEELRESIYDRDDHTCQGCGVPQAECLRSLNLHHIDYNKSNMVETDLISLCDKCHGKTSYNREYWQSHFEEMIAKIYAPGGGD